MTNAPLTLDGWQAFPANGKGSCPNCGMTVHYATGIDYEDGQFVYKRYCDACNDGIVIDATGPTFASVVPDHVQSISFSLRYTG